MIHQIIINDTQIDLFLKLIQNAKITKYNTAEKEEMDILSLCFKDIKTDKDSETLHDLTDY
jgi:hypothetical protein